MPSFAMLVALILPPALCLAASIRFRRESATAHAIIWLMGLPLLYLVIPMLVLLISFQVFGVDLVD